MSSLHGVLPGGAATPLAPVFVHSSDDNEEEEEEKPVVVSEFVSSLNGHRVSVSDHKTFKLMGYYHAVDFYPDQCLQLNGNKRYPAVLESMQKYKIPVPWDLFVWKEFRDCTLVFSLPSESCCMWDFLTQQRDSRYTDLSAKREDDALLLKKGDRFRDIEMTINKSQIMQTLCIPLDLANHNGFHVIPVHVNIETVDSTFPVTMVAEFHTTKANRPAVEGGFKKWSRRRAVRSTFSVARPLPVGAIASGDDSAFVSGYVIAPNARTVSVDNVLYYAPEEVNHPDFSRWVCANVPYLFNVLNSSKIIIQSNGVPSCAIKCPPVLTEPRALSESNLLFWVVAAHFDEIMRRTEERGLLSAESGLGKISVNSTNESYIHVAKTVIDEFLRDQQRVYNKDEILMNLNTVKLTVRPLNGQSGWDDLVGITNTRKESSDVMPLHTDDMFARLRVSVRMVVHPYTDKTAATQSSSSSSF